VPNSHPSRSPVASDDAGTALCRDKFVTLNSGDLRSSDRSFLADCQSELIEILERHRVLEEADDPKNALAGDSKYAWAWR
jgi:hypothetical protein